jgi:hypothetical protein
MEEKHVSCLQHSSQRGALLTSTHLHNLTLRKNWLPLPSPIKIIQNNKPINLTQLLLKNKLSILKQLPIHPPFLKKNYGGFATICFESATNEKKGRKMVFFKFQCKTTDFSCEKASLQNWFFNCQFEFRLQNGTSALYSAEVSMPERATPKEKQGNIQNTSVLHTHRILDDLGLVRLIVAFSFKWRGLAHNLRGFFQKV